MGRQILRQMIRRNSGRPPEKSSWKTLLALGSLFLPILGVCWFIWVYGVNVPYLDEWTLAADLDRATTLRGLVSTLLIADNDHPILVPKLIFIGLAHLTDWNTKVNMFLVLVSSVIAFLAIARMADTEQIRSDKFRTWLGLLVSSLLMFSFVHYDTWLHGWALTHVLGDTCTILAILVLATSEREPVLRLFVAWILCFIGSLSYLGGLVGWFAIIPCIFILFQDRKRQILASVSSLGLCVGCLLLFKFVFVIIRFPTDRLFWFEHPLMSAEYFLGLLGAPLAQTGIALPQTLALIIGAGLIAVLLVTCGITIRYQRLSTAVPWLSIALYGLGVALLNTVGRGSFGPVAAAVISRYMIDSVLVAVAVLQLSRHALQKWEFIALALLFGTLSVWGSKEALSPAAAIKEARIQASDCLFAANYTDPRMDESTLNPLYPLCPFPDCFRNIMRPGLRYVSRLGFWGMSEHVPFVDDRSRVYGAFEQPKLNDRPLSLRDGDTLDAGGWVATRQQTAPPTCVLVTAGQAGVLAKAVGIPDHIRRRREEGGLASPKVQWSIAIPAGLLPGGTSVLRAWIYDKRSRQFVKLEGQKLVSRTLSER